nr:DNA (cytosine-5-)-methyltransferase [Actinomadura rayongensis]
MFSGIGAFDLAARRAGLDVGVAVEIDAACRGVLAHHWPGQRLHHDVREVTADDLGPAEVMLAGWPCQDLSLAGRRRGLAGTRSSLWWEVSRLAEQMRPSWIVLENVPGLLTSQRGAAFAAVLRSLAGLGYGLAWRVLDAQFFGLAQQRRRVFVLGHLGDRAGRAAAAEVLLDPGRSAVRPPAARRTRETVSALTAWGLGGGGPDPKHAQAGWLRPVVLHGRPAVRKLTPLECERLMGLPDNWTRYADRAGRTREQSDTARYRQVGNALPVPVASWVLAGIAKAPGRWPGACGPR